MLSSNSQPTSPLCRRSSAEKSRICPGLTDWKIRLETWGILSWILLGLIAGALAKFIVPGKDPGGCLVTIIVGIVGAIVGGFLESFIGLGRVESFDFGGIIIATSGAILL